VLRVANQEANLRSMMRGGSLFVTQSGEPLAQTGELVAQSGEPLAQTGEPVVETGEALE